ncbi:MAG: methylmalonyl Co-A mutase-associated GTPase MeaB, partial [Candidatus Dadabacteria bacterium]|nr:methylmalonyl Co-A mutase-associated GTPase MeaB [Candidatus Dadabacteria bacterium]
MLLMITGAGDDNQGIKKGIIELADAVLKTKADGRNKKKAELMKQEMEEALGFHRPPESGWGPRAYACSSVTGYGIKEIWQCVMDYEDLCRENGYFTEKRRKQAKYRLHEA